MCGIVGILDFRPNAHIDDAIVRRMCAAIAHRGPDDQGIRKEANIALGMRRLSIVDVAGGHQPIGNEDGTVWIVFNGEIYNQANLREQLVARGHRFSTHSDTETIVHLYEEYGRDCLQHLRGMFAFAIWDSRKRCLFAARDRLGIKPLYYSANGALFLLASEIKALFAYPGFSPELDSSSLPECLAFGYIAGAATMYTGISKLLPGHWLEIDESGRCEIGQYWDAVASERPGECDRQSYVGKYRELLESAVQSHLMSDVPVGVFLSGGLDSSAVAALMTRIRKAPIETFSVGYNEDHFSELPHARIVAQHIKAKHREVVVSEQDFFDLLPRLIWHEDEPIAWPSSVALYFLARSAREHVKVVLTGEGSDETLAGYSRYALTLRNASYDGIYRKFIPSAIRLKIREAILHSRLLNSSLRRSLGHTFLARDGACWQDFYFDNFLTAFNRTEQQKLFNSGRFLTGECYRETFGHWNRAPGSLMQRMLYTDIKTYLVELLMKQDNMSMAASLESRVPFLDHELVQFALNIPRPLLINGFSGKEILKKAIADLLPESIIRRKKLGFPTPWKRWLTGPRIEALERLLLGARSADRRQLDSSVVRQIFREHRSRHRDHSDRIWRLLNLEVWQRVCVEGDSPESVARDLGGSGTPVRRNTSIALRRPSPASASA